VIGGKNQRKTAIQIAHPYPFNKRSEEQIIAFKYRITNPGNQGTGKDLCYQQNIMNEWKSISHQ